MPSQLPQVTPKDALFSERRTWLKPAFARLRTGEAEAQDGSGSDTTEALS